MSVLFITVLMPVLAQADQKADDVYEILPKNGGESYFAYIVESSATRLQLQIYYKPGMNAGDRIPALKADVDTNLIGRDAADRAIARRLDAVSEVINGERYPKQEVERAKQAREWARDLEDRLNMPDPSPADPVAAPDTAEPNASPLALRGPQIGLVLCSFILIGIIVKLLILG